jgi:hypothetical protein
MTFVLVEAMSAFLLNNRTTTEIDRLAHLFEHVMLQLDMLERPSWYDPLGSRGWERARGIGDGERGN